MDLDSLLRRVSGSSSSAVPTSSTPLYKMERITLAVNLASFLLQLNATPWFNERWNKKDISFVADKGNTNSRPIDIERPLVAHKFLSSGITSPTLPYHFPHLYIQTLAFCVSG
ncbi:hypothetical protein EAF04_010641 [Stromatinia cepivora]|nr:hypothetical protein EAF04_010641 [Stromatinia cepivora]